jgi:chromosome segregation ATPase
MIRNDKFVLLLVTACLGLWGCARVSATGTREAERIKFLEAKVAKLEEDFRTAAAARDLWKQKAAIVEKERGELAKQLPVVVQERDDLRAQLSSRTTERDSLQTQYDSFRKEIRTLLGHADAAAGRVQTQQPVTVAPTPPVPGQS